MDIDKPDPIVSAIKEAHRVLGSLVHQLRASIATSTAGVVAATAMESALVRAEAAGDALLVAATVDDQVVEEPLHPAMRTLRDRIAELDGEMRTLAAPSYPVDASRRLGYAQDLYRLHQRIVDAISAVKVPDLGSPSVGFEYELVYAKVMTPNVPSKTLLKHWFNAADEEILRLEVDGGDVEFITAPVATQLGLAAQLDLIEQEVQAIAHAGERGISYAIPVPALSAEDGSEALPVNTRVLVTHPGQVRGKIQATAGRRLDQLSQFLIMYGGEVGLESWSQSQTFGAVGKAAGLMHLVEYYIESLRQSAPNETQGPKVLLHAMSRTDFHSAYRQLTDEERLSFKELIDYEGGRHTADAVRAAPICPPKGAKQVGYLGPAGAGYTGPQVGAWLDSIVIGDASTPDTEPLDRDNDGEGPRGAERDLLSPPLGYPAHRRGRHFTYAMGRFGTATDGALLLEIRAIDEDAAFNVASLRTQATTFLAAQLESDDQRTTRINAAIQGIRNGGTTAKKGILAALKVQLTAAELRLATALLA